MRTLSVATTLLIATLGTGFVATTLLITALGTGLIASLLTFGIVARTIALGTRLIATLFTFGIIARTIALRTRLIASLLAIGIITRTIALLTGLIAALRTLAVTTTLLIAVETRTIGALLGRSGLESCSKAFGAECTTIIGSRGTLGIERTLRMDTRTLGTGPGTIITLIVAYRLVALAATFVLLGRRILSLVFEF